MVPHLAQVAVVADVVADAVLVRVDALLALAGQLLDRGKGFQDGAGVALPAAEVVHLCRAGRLGELVDEGSDVLRVDVIAHLLALVAEDLILAALHVAFDEVAQEAVELDAGVVGAGQTAAAQTAGGHGEIASVFLHHDVRGRLRGAEERVLGLVDGECLRYALGEGGVVIVPARLQFFEPDRVGQVPVDLVGGEVDEGRLRAGPPRGLQEVERAYGVGVEVIEGDVGGPVVRVINTLILLNFPLKKILKILSLKS